MKIAERTGEQFILLKYMRHYADNFIFVTIEQYINCGFRCTYCLAESQGSTRPAMTNMSDFRRQLSSELDAFSSDNYVFCVSGTTDPYIDIEEHHGYTRHVIDELTARNRRFSVTTKGPLVVRDLDLFQRLQPSDRQKYFISLSASTAELVCAIESHAPSPEARIEAVHRLHAAGLNAGVLISPWIPELTDTDRLLSLLPKGINIAIHPLDLGLEWDEPFDIKRQRSSADVVFSKTWSQDAINRAYIQECNTVGKKYKNHFDIEWRLPIARAAHPSNSAFMKRMRPGRFDPDQWVAENQAR